MAGGREQHTSILAASTSTWVGHASAQYPQTPQKGRGSNAAPLVWHREQLARTPTSPDAHLSQKPLLPSTVSQPAQCAVEIMGSASDTWRTTKQTHRRAHAHTLIVTQPRPRGRATRHKPLPHSAPPTVDLTAWRSALAPTSALPKSTSSASTASLNTILMLAAGVSIRGWLTTPRHHIQPSTHTYICVDAHFVCRPTPVPRCPCINDTHACAGACV